MTTPAEVEKNFDRTLDELDERAKAATDELLSLADEFRQAVDAFEGVVAAGRLRGLHEAVKASDEAAAATVRSLRRITLRTG